MTARAGALRSLSLALLLGACSTADPLRAVGDQVAPSPVELLAQGGVVELEPQVVATTAHDPAAFTQGLEEHEGVLLESTGRYGRSDRRRVDPSTGEVLASVALPDDHFGEGLTVVDDRVIQLTWREGVAHVADAASLAAEAALPYEGEGWGLCYDGQRLVMSDGTATLAFRDPTTFAEAGHVEVTMDGAPVTRLNELECTEGLVWANVWLTTDIVAIDPTTGSVKAVVDAEDLVPPDLGPDAVLNGIARRPDADTYWLTGKEWPVLYEVRFVPAPER